MAQLLVSLGPWQRQVCRDKHCLSHRGYALSESFFEPLVAGDQKASLASLSPQLCPLRHLGTLSAHSGTLLPGSFSAVLFSGT